ncbi:MAG: hypothetical protein A2104_02950 [Candidatus Melainabacteria bacterium GWF2_32_7]|nr:MAG: hypothetical protein A2104_02950 [Candidatus Melainabacteria bacterium GWF2_32_7]
MKILSGILIVILKVSICLFLTLILCACSGVVAFADRYDWQIILYLTLSILIVVGFWLVFFIKMKRTIKLVYLILFILYLFIPKTLPSVMQQFNIDNCLDSGGCWDSIRNRCEMQDQGKCVITIEE